MRTILKLLAVALVLLFIGVAVAAPQVFYQENGVMDFDATGAAGYDQPVLGNPEGPKADFSVEPAYVAFRILGDYSNLNVSNSRFVVEYQVVFNVTNLSDREAEMTHADFAAAGKIEVLPAVIADVLFSRAGETLTGSCGGMVEGLWLDDKWVSTTWIPGKDYPSNLFREIRYEHNVTATIPDLPADASETGTWVNAVPIAQYRNASGIQAVHMYINGAWVEVTGRVRADPAQPFLKGSNTLIACVTTYGAERYPADPQLFGSFNTDAVPSRLWNRCGDSVMSYRWAYGMNGSRGFDCTWKPKQSRLLMLNGSRTVFSTSGFDALESGNITFYAAVANYVSKPPVNGVFSDNSLTAFWIKNIQLENTADGYVYNTLLNSNETFQTDLSGLEAYIVPKSSVSVSLPLGNQTIG